ncbi:DUF1572 domain-containing protein [Chitinophaga pendula]|uniref:DinB family protein n=1 Tax=Chitinophaga TaxID=79328 RepID=UPI000BAF0586|nr:MULTISPECIES: DUF1572 family protein [Chitinophaga]ASZ12953.1 DinB superfamily protein [Chitinophaga sp. MD30]UCJ09416.1 DUF1572 domain-containing protein [Chitinophaga pendula]
MLTTTLINIFDRDLGKLEEEIRTFKQEELLWKTLPGITNSAGNLTLHLAGNLRHFVGALLGNTGYIRDRDKEFSAKDIPAADLLSAIAETKQVVKETIGKLSADDLDKTYPVKIFDTELTTGYFLVHLLSHLSYHLGQINYLRRILQP